MKKELTYIANKRGIFKTIQLPALPGDRVYTYHESTDEIIQMYVRSVTLEKDGILYCLQYEKDGVTIDFQTTSEEVYLMELECRSKTNIKRNKKETSK